MNNLGEIRKTSTFVTPIPIDKVLLYGKKHEYDPPYLDELSKKTETELVFIDE